MANPVVIIIKSSPWKYSHLSANHPEYLAISNLINRHASDVDFVLAGTSKQLLCGFRMRNNVIAWDIPSNGITGNLTYNLHLFRIFLEYRPQLIIILGLTQVVPALAFSFLSFRSKCVPIPMFDGFDYPGRRVSGKFLFLGQLKLMSLALRVSQMKIPVIFALSKFVRDSIERMAPNLKGKITLISYPIQPLFYSSRTRSFQVAHEPTILTVAGIEPRKGLDVLIRAVSLIPKKLRPRVIIKGQIRDQLYMQQLDKMMINLDLENWIKFDTNTVDYNLLPAYYQAATLFVFPTRQDALGVVLLEALNSGLPVVATSVGGVPDVIETGVNGLLIEPDNPQELANGILLILKDEKMRQTLSRNAVQVLDSRYYNRTTLEEALEESVGLIMT